MLSPKKIYFIDNAIINRIGFNATENKGIYLENAVFLELKRRGLDVFYYDGKKECDFIVRQGVRIVGAYQVTMEMANEQTRAREIAGVREAMQTYGLTTGYILTMEQRESIKLEDGTTVEVLPAWQWMMQPQLPL